MPAKEGRECYTTIDEKQKCVRKIERENTEQQNKCTLRMCGFTWDTTFGTIIVFLCLLFAFMY